MAEREKFSRLRISTKKKIEDIMEHALEGLIYLDEDTRDIVIGRLFGKCKMNAYHRVLIGLLGYKALNIIGWREEDSVSAKELSEKLGLNYNTVRAILSQLVKDKYAVQKGRGKYTINISLIEKISEIISNIKRECEGLLNE